ncbi:MAG: EF-hand domain-containing protein [Betaproteobacteria bacterium]|nr:EF-hand domain-containing protein [Betaproteobacteria bacterium]
MLCFTTGATAQVTPPPVFETQPCDPCVPESVRQKAMAATPLPTQSVAEAVTRRLKARFDAADANRTGALTRAQAEAGGFGFIAQNFEAIDRKRAGAVTFEDVKGFLLARGAKLD